MRLTLLPIVAAIAALLLVPVKASVDFAVGSGLLDPLHLTTIALVAAMALLPLARYGDFRDDYGRVTKLALLMAWAWVCAASVFAFREWFFEQPTSAEGLDSVVFNGVLLLSYPLYFLAGYYLKFDRFSRMTWVVGLGACTLAVFAAGGGVLVEVDAMQYAIRNHLALSDAIAVTGLLLMGAAATAGQRLLVAVLVALLLSSVLSRTGFFLFIGSALLYEILLRMGGDLRKSVLFGFVGLLALWLLLSALDIPETPELKALRLPGLFGADASADERWVMLTVGMRRLMGSWLLGDYWGHVEHFGSAGAYIHNILAYWQQFGLPAFLLVFAATVVGVGQLAVRLEAVFDDTRPRLMERLPVIIYVLLASLLARSYVFPLLWMGLGLLAGANFRAAEKADEAAWDGAWDGGWDGALEEGWPDAEAAAGEPRRGFRTLDG